MADDMEMHMANEMWVFFHISLSIVCIFCLGPVKFFAIEYTGNDLLKAECIVICMNFVFICVWEERGKLKWINVDCRCGWAPLAWEIYATLDKAKYL